MSEIGIEIAAAGKSNRMREYISKLGYPDGFPKLLLPTGEPNDETLLGRVIKQAMEAPVPGPITIHTSPENDAFLQEDPGITRLVDGSEVRVRYEEYGNSFRPFIPKLVREGVPVLGSSGDFYADFTWVDVLDTHGSNDYPVTFVVGQTIPVNNGAVFNISDKGQITDFARVERTVEGDFVNVGIYVFEPTQAVLDTLSTLVTDRNMAREEETVTSLIENGLMGAHVLSSTPYNVNSGETYEALLAHTASQQAVA